MSSNGHDGDGRNPYAKLVSKRVGVAGSSASNSDRNSEGSHRGDSTRKPNPIGDNLASVRLEFGLKWTEMMHWYRTVQQKRQLVEGRTLPSDLPSWTRAPPSPSLSAGGSPKLVTLLKLLPKAHSPSTQPAQFVEKLEILMECLESRLEWERDQGEFEGEEDTKGTRNREIGITHRRWHNGVKTALEGLLVFRVPPRLTGKMYDLWIRISGQSPGPNVRGVALANHPFVVAIRSIISYDEAHCFEKTGLRIEKSAALLDVLQSTMGSESLTEAVLRGLGAPEAESLAKAMVSQDLIECAGLFVTMWEEANNMCPAEESGTNASVWANVLRFVWRNRLGDSTSTLFRNDAAVLDTWYDLVRRYVRYSEQLPPQTISSSTSPSTHQKVNAMLIQTLGRRPTTPSDLSLTHLLVIWSLSMLSEKLPSSDIVGARDADTMPCDLVPPAWLIVYIELASGTSGGHSEHKNGLEKRYVAHGSSIVGIPFAYLTEYIRAISLAAVRVDSKTSSMLTAAEAVTQHFEPHITKLCQIIIDQVVSPYLDPNFVLIPAKSNPEVDNLCRAAFEYLSRKTDRHRRNNEEPEVSDRHHLRASFSYLLQTDFAKRNWVGAAEIVRVYLHSPYVRASRKAAEEREWLWLNIGLMFSRLVGRERVGRVQDVARDFEAFAKALDVLLVPDGENRGERRRGGDGEDVRNGGSGKALDVVSQSLTLLIIHRLNETATRGTLPSAREIFRECLNALRALSRLGLQIQTRTLVEMFLWITESEDLEVTAVMDFLSAVSGGSSSVGPVLSGALKNDSRDWSTVEKGVAKAIHGREQRKRRMRSLNDFSHSIRSPIENGSAEKEEVSRCRQHRQQEVFRRLRVYLQGTLDSGHTTAVRSKPFPAAHGVEGAQGGPLRKGMDLGYVSPGVWRILAHTALHLNQTKHNTKDVRSKGRGEGNLTRTHFDMEGLYLSDTITRYTLQQLEHAVIECSRLDAIDQLREKWGFVLECREICANLVTRVTEKYLERAVLTSFVATQGKKDEVPAGDVDGRGRGRGSNKSHIGAVYEQTESAFDAADPLRNASELFELATSVSSELGKVLKGSLEAGSGGDALIRGLEMMASGSSSLSWAVVLPRRGLLNKLLDACVKRELLEIPERLVVGVLDVLYSVDGSEMCQIQPADVSGSNGTGGDRVMEKGSAVDPTTAPRLAQGAGMAWHPDTTSYNILVKSYLLRNDLAKADEVFDLLSTKMPKKRASRLPSHHIPNPDHIMILRLLNASIRARHTTLIRKYVDIATDVFFKHLSVPSHPFKIAGEDTTRHKSDSSVANNTKEDNSDVIGVGSTAKINHSQWVYVLLRGFATLGDSEGMERVLHQITSSDDELGHGLLDPNNRPQGRIPLDAQTLTVVISGFSKAGRADLVAKWVEPMLRRSLAVADTFSETRRVLGDGDMKNKLKGYSMWSARQGIRGVASGWVDWPVINALMSSYVRSGDETNVNDAMRLFETVVGRLPWVDGGKCTNGASLLAKTTPETSRWVSLLGPPSIDTFNILIWGASRAGQTHVAMRIFDYLSSSSHEDPKPNLITHNIMIDMYVRHGLFSRALSHHERYILGGTRENKEAPVPGFPTRETVRESSGGLDEGWRQDAEDDDGDGKEEVVRVQPDAYTYSALIRGYIYARDDLDTALRLFGTLRIKVRTEYEKNKKKKGSGVVPRQLPDQSIYDALVYAWCRRGNTTKAKTVLVEMMREQRAVGGGGGGGIPLSACNAGLKGLVEMGLMKDAWKWVEDVFAEKVGGVGPGGTREADLIAVVSLETHHAGKSGRDTPLIGDLNCWSVTPDMTTFNLLIQGFLKCGDVIEAERCLQTAWTFAMLSNRKARGTLTGASANQTTPPRPRFGVPQTRTLNILVDGLCKLGLPDRAASWLALLCGRKWKSCFTGGVVDGESMGDSSVRDRETDSNQEVRKPMEQHIRLPSTAPQLPLPLSLENTSVRIIIEPDTVTFNTFIDHYTKRGDYSQAEKWFSRLVQEGSRNVISDAGGEATSNDSDRMGMVLNVDEEDRIHHQLPASAPALGSGVERISPHTNTYNIFISSYAHQGDLLNALNWYCLMRSPARDHRSINTVVPDGITYAAIMDAVGRYGMRRPFVRSNSSAERYTAAVEKGEELAAKAPVPTIEGVLCRQGGIQAEMMAEAVGVMVNMIRTSPNTTRILSPSSGLAGLTAAAASTALDVCGHYYRPTEARLVWSRLRSAQFPLEENQYCSYLEALIRCGYPKEAWNVYKNEVIPFLNRKGKGTRKQDVKTESRAGRRQKAGGVVDDPLVEVSGDMGPISLPLLVPGSSGNANLVPVGRDIKMQHEDVSPSVKTVRTMMGGLRGLVAAIRRLQSLSAHGKGKDSRSPQQLTDLKGQGEETRKGKAKKGGGITETEGLQEVVLVDGRSALEILAEVEQIRPDVERTFGTVV
ncbi:hypothetical protein HK102_001238 [Quaeritorhiza haematococci]|nr:hypothetical protein HK102_001238 [Quaeritorhiza haematococci]